MNGYDDLKYSDKPASCSQCDYYSTCDSGTACLYNSVKPKSGCFITTATLVALNKPDNCYELTMFRQFRDNYMKNNYPALVEEYYILAPKIVAIIDRQEENKTIYMNIWNDYLSKCLQMIENRNYKSSMDLYMLMVRKLRSIFIIKTNTK